VGFIVRNPLRDLSQPEPQSYPIAKQAYLPYLLDGTRLHPGFILACVMAVVIFIILFKTHFGYEVRAVGFNSSAARYAGINGKMTIIATMLISGALAGIGGAFELAGATHFLYENISGGFGFTAIAISVLAGNNPIGVVFSATLFAFLINGSTAMQRNIGVSASFADIVQGIIIIFVAVAAVQTARKQTAKKSLSLKKGGRGV
jgi:simple sugar transport system permease protein